MCRSFCRDFKSDLGASLVEYSMAVVFIGLAAVLVLGFVGRATSDAFDEVGGAFPTDPQASSPVVNADVFDELLALIQGLGSPGSSFVGKAEEAKIRHEEGDADGALGKLDSLIKEVDAQRGKALTDEEAAAVHAAVQELVDIIETG